MNEARFRQAVAQVLAARDGADGAGLALDDLHFADLASLELLPSLIAPALRCALAVRGAEMPLPLAAWQGAEAGAALVEIALPPLAEADVRQLLETLALDGLDAAALAAPLARHTGGNPYFVLETLGALVTQADERGAGLPTAPTVGALIERRLAQLSRTGIAAGPGGGAGGSRLQRGTGGARAAGAPARPHRRVERAGARTGANRQRLRARPRARRCGERHPGADRRAAPSRHRRLPRGAGGGAGAHRAALRRRRTVAPRRRVPPARRRGGAAQVAARRGGRAARGGDLLPRPRRRCRCRLRRPLREHRERDPGSRGRTGAGGDRRHAGGGADRRSARGGADRPRQRLADGGGPCDRRGLRARGARLRTTRTSRGCASRRHGCSPSAWRSRAAPTRPRRC